MWFESFPLVFGGIYGFNIGQQGLVFWASLSLASPRSVCPSDLSVLVWLDVRPNIHWVVPIVGSSFFTVGVITLFNAVLIYLGMAYLAHAPMVWS
jgi:DHA1 family multidrug resistance protein-like MFS transporter